MDQGEAFSLPRRCQLGLATVTLSEPSVTRGYLARLSSSLRRCFSGESHTSAKLRNRGIRSFLSSSSIVDRTMKWLIGQRCGPHSVVSSLLFQRRLDAATCLCLNGSSLWSYSSFTSWRKYVVVYNFRCHFVTRGFHYCWLFLSC